ncbi:MAG: phosphoglucosamine mutase [Actinomycetota bacterium]
MGRLFGTDGVRGAYGETLTDALARELGFGAASVLGGDATHSPILIGRDTRGSGPALERALAAGIRAAGGVPVTCGVMPTAGVAHLVNAGGFAAGAVISASHNPARDNGIKFFGADGMKLSDALEDRIETAMEDPGLVEPALESFDDADETYLRFLLDGSARLEGVRLVVDCANGAASAIAPEVYRDAGATVTVIHADPDGTNINDHCGSTHPERLQEAVVAHGAHLGIAHDGDADRMLAADAHGRMVDGDQILGLIAIDALARGVLPNDTVVSTVMANMGFRRAMRDAGISFIETAVGDRYVLAAMLEHGAAMGGEQSGHLVFLQRHTTGDGILTALELGAVIARTGMSLSELAKQVPRFPQVLVNVPVRDRNELIGAEAVWESVEAAEAALAGSGRVLVRASGTEQLVRVMAEAETTEAAQAAVDQVVAAVRDTLAD